MWKLLVLAGTLLFSLSCGCLEKKARATTTAIVPKISQITSSDAETLWILTRDNELLRMRSNESPTPIATPALPERVFFLDSNTGWFYGENDKHIWATSDGGDTWTQKGTHPEFGISPVELVFTDRNNGWLVMTFTVFWTADAGQTWTMVYPTADLDYGTLGGQPTAISVVDNDTVWIAMTANSILLTRDRGTTWTHSNPMEGRPDVRSILAKSADEAWAGPGGGGVSGLYHTSDGGKTWKQLLEDPVRMRFGKTSIALNADGRGWLFGLRFVTDVDRPTPTTGYAFRTTDGTKWTLSKNPIANVEIDDIHFADSRTGWIVGYRHEEDRSHVYQTKDGGETWNLVYQAQGGERFDDERSGLCSE